MTTITPQIQSSGTPSKGRARVFIDARIAALKTQSASQNIALAGTVITFIVFLIAVKFGFHPGIRPSVELLAFFLTALIASALREGRRVYAFSLLLCVPVFAAIHYDWSFTDTGSDGFYKFWLSMILDGFIIWIWELIAAKRWRWAYVLPLGCAGAVAAISLLGFEWLLTQGDIAWKVGVLYFIVFIGMTIIAVHLWSVGVMRKLSSPSDPDKDKLCDYCGDKPAYVVCHNCDSIQWKVLDKLQKDEPTERLALAVFVAHHRWKLLGSFLPVVLVSALAFAAQLQVELWKSSAADEARYDTEERDVINAMIGFRSALPELIALCQSGKSDDKVCRERFQAFTTDYYRVSWNAKPVIDRLIAKCKKEGAADGLTPVGSASSRPSASSTSSSPAPHASVRPTDSTDSAYSVLTFNLACKVLNKNTTDLDDLDGKFETFENAYLSMSLSGTRQLSPDAGTSEATTTETPTQLSSDAGTSSATAETPTLCTAAEDLFLTGRVVACAIEIVQSHARSYTKPHQDDCTQALKFAVLKEEPRRSKSLSWGIWCPSR